MNKITILLINFLLLLSCSFSQSPVSGNKSPEQSVKLGEIPIQTDRDTYSPVMSSTVGIGLTPAYSMNRSPETVKFKWSTNYGFFLSWEAPDFKVNNLGSSVEYGYKKIYWSYNPSDSGVDKPDVTVTLDVIDAVSGKTLTTSKLQIIWESQNIAKVKK